MLSVEKLLNKAIIAHKSNNFHDANELYEGILKIDSENPGASHGKAVLLLREGRTSEALPFFKNAINGKLEKAEYWSNYIKALVSLERIIDARFILDLAKSKGAKGDYWRDIELEIDSAAANLKKRMHNCDDSITFEANILDASSIESAIKKAKKHAKSGNNIQAIKILNDILIRFPNNKIARQQMEKIHLLGKNGGQKFVDLTQSQLSNILSLYNNGNFHAVLDETVLLLKKHNKSVQILLIRGAAEIALGKCNDAIASYEHILTIEPNSVDAYTNLGAASRLLGDMNKAIAYYRKALILRPNHINAWLNMGNAHQENEDLEKATECYKKVIGIKPDHSEAYISLGVTFQKLGRINDAISSYKKSIFLDSESYEAHFNLGVAHYKQREITLAIAAYQESLKINSDYAEAWNNLGTAEKERGNRDKSIDSYERAIAINPSFAEAHSNLGLVYEDKACADQAILSYEKALKLKPDNLEISTNLAKILYLSGEYQRAGEIFRRFNTSESKYWLLKSLYKQNCQQVFCSALKTLTENGENNAVIGSLVSRSNIRYGLDTINPFCNDALGHSLKVNMADKYDFENIFGKFASDMCANNSVSRKTQNLLTNGFQTSGNIFAGEGKLAKTIEDILILEVENYREYFIDSEEGLIKNWPANYRISGWLVSMTSGGHLSAHMHDNGWITGSVYIKVPRTHQDDSGNLVVSMEDVTEEQPITKNRKSINVSTGDLFLFPSSLLHYTTPFQGEDDRVVLAFDVIPVD